MIKIENTEVFGFEAALRGMRNPLASHERSDSDFCIESGDHCAECEYTKLRLCGGDMDRNSYANYLVGENDLGLMKRLCKAGPEHRKYLRMIHVQFDMTCGHPIWAEMDTYKIATVRNSCSKMHKIHAKKFTVGDFDHEGIDEVADALVDSTFNNLLMSLERLRCLFNETKEKKYWRAMIELLPMGYHLKATMDMNYETLIAIYHQRKGHKMQEWHKVCNWIEALPYMKDLLEIEG